MNEKLTQNLSYFKFGVFLLCMKQETYIFFAIFKKETEYSFYKVISVKLKHKKFIFERTLSKQENISLIVSYLLNYFSVNSIHKDIEDKNQVAYSLLSKTLLDLFIISKYLY